MQIQASQLRRATLDDLDTIISFIRQSKGYWGHDENTLNHFMQILNITPALLDQTDTKIILLYQNNLQPASDPSTSPVPSTTPNPLIGLYGFLRESDQSLELAYFFIHPDYIGQGLGKALWAIMLETAKSYPDETFALWSDPMADQFYEKMGCHKINTRASALQPGRHLSQYRYIFR